MQLHWMGYSGVQPLLGRQLCCMPYCTAADSVLLSSTSRLACVHMHETPGDGCVHSPGLAGPLSSAPAQTEAVHAVTPDSGDSSNRRAGPPAARPPERHPSRPPGQRDQGIIHPKVLLPSCGVAPLPSWPWTWPLSLQWQVYY